MQHDTRTARFMDALATDPPPRMLWQMATDYLGQMGFDRVINVAVPPGGRTPEIRTNMPTDFLQAYQAEGFAADDPFFKYCLPSKISIATGIAYLDDYDYLSHRACDLIELAGSAGFRAGFSVTAAHAGPGGLEGWNIGSSLNRNEVEAIRTHHGAEISFALLALRGRLSPLRGTLSKREHEVMHLLIQGHRTKEIAAQLGIRMVTVDFHLANAKRKLGASTREAAVARFLQH